MKLVCGGGGVAKLFVDIDQGSGAASDTRGRSSGERPGIPVPQCGRLGALSSSEAPAGVGGDAFERIRGT